MTMQEIIDSVRTFEGSLAVVPDSGSGFPRLAWGDAFFYYAPDGVMPERTQPYGTIITKDYPDDRQSQLDAPGRYRVNIHLGRRIAHGVAEDGTDAAASDVFFAHPLYGDAGWVSVVNPGSRSAGQVVDLLRLAHGAARARTIRRVGRP